MTGKAAAIGSSLSPRCGVPTPLAPGVNLGELEGLEPELEPELELGRTEPEGIEFEAFEFEAFEPEAPNPEAFEPEGIEFEAFEPEAPEATACRSFR